MGTVPRQISVPNSSMQHRELLKWYCLSARFSARVRRAGKIKIRYDLSCVFFFGASYTIAADTGGYRGVISYDTHGRIK
jgi:hypothetical protein